jgi:ferritin-like metal-binding protein YciE
MSPESKVIEHLAEAYAAERAAGERLSHVIGRTGRADHRVHLESHLVKEREHAQRVESRLRELSFSEGPIATIAALAGGVVTGTVRLITSPLGLLRGSASDDEILHNAEELASTEAREVARYRALERLARRAGDDQTAELAASIRVQEEDQLELLGREIPRLADHVLGGEAAAQVRERRTRARPERKRTPARKRPAQQRPPAQRRGGVETSAPSHHPRTHSETAGPDRAEAARIRDEEREREEAEAQEVARDPEADPEGPGAELHVDEPWPGYDSMSAAEVAERLRNESEAVRAEARLYEASHARRELVMRATSED